MSTKLTSLMLFFLLVSGLVSVSSRAAPAPSLMVFSGQDKASGIQEQFEKSMMKALSSAGVRTVYAAEYFVRKGLLKAQDLNNRDKVAGLLLKFQYMLNNSLVIEPRMEMNTLNEWVPSVHLKKADDLSTVIMFDTFPIPAEPNNKIDMAEIDAAAYGLAVMLLDHFENQYNEQGGGYFGQETHKVRIAIRGASSCQHQYGADAIRSILNFGEDLVLLEGRAANLRNYTLNTFNQVDSITSELSNIFSKDRLRETKNYEMFSRAKFIEIRFYPDAIPACN